MITYDAAKIEETCAQSGIPAMESLITQKASKIADVEAELTKRISELKVDYNTAKGTYDTTFQAYSA